MDSSQLDLAPLEQKFKNNQVEGEKLGKDSLGKPDSSHFDKLANQRHEQRDQLFWFAIRSSSWSLMLLTASIVGQAWSRIVFGANFSLFSGFELEILSVSIFSQLIGVVALITKSLWDDRPIKDILKSDHEHKHG